MSCQDNQMLAATSYKKIPNTDVGIGILLLADIPRFHSVYVIWANVMPTPD